MSDLESAPFEEPDAEAFEPEPPEPAPPDTRGRALVRLGFCTLLAGLLLWLPVTRLAWSLEVVERGAFGPGVVVREAEPTGEVEDEAKPTKAVTVEYADPVRRTVFLNREEWLPGDGIDLAWLPTDRPNEEGMGARVARAAPGSGVSGVYFGLDGWPLDLILVPLGLALALGALLNLAAVLRPRAPADLESVERS